MLRIWICREGIKGCMFFLRHGWRSGMGSHKLAQVNMGIDGLAHMYNTANNHVYGTSESWCLASKSCVPRFQSYMRSLVCLTVAGNRALQLQPLPLPDLR